MEKVYFWAFFMAEGTPWAFLGSNTPPRSNAEKNFEISWKFLQEQKVAGMKIQELAVKTVVNSEVLR